MNCNIENRINTIEKYLSGELPKDEREAFDVHLFDCDICFRELKFIQDRNAVLKEKPLLSKEEIEIHISGRNWILKIAASLILLAGLAYLINLYLNSKSPQIAENFQISSALETEIEIFNRQRSDLKIIVLSPTNETQYLDESRFLWELSPNGQISENLLFIKIFDNRGKMLIEAQAAPDQYLLKENLSEGLYYWKLEWKGENILDSEVMYIGKFIIRK